MADTPAVKAFKTSARAASDDEQVVTFTVDDTLFTATRPQSTQFILLSALHDEDFGKQAQGMGKFIDACLPRKQRGVLAARLSNPDDPFEIDDLTDIFRYLMSEFTGRPTTSQSD